MAKNNNLKDFLTDVADAIRAKKGTTGLINPQDFSSEIASISTGGSGGGAVVSKSKNDVTFYDYDGTVLHSYTKNEFLALSAMPELPTRKGLICQEWNWDFEDAIAYVRDYGILDVGATYITDDGKTRLYIRIAANGRMDVPLYFSQTVQNGVVVDWGDGSKEQTFVSAGNNHTTHKYAEIGDYVITLDPVEGCDLRLGWNDITGVLGETSINKIGVYRNMLQRVEFGRNITVLAGSFYNCYSLASVVIPNSMSSIQDHTFTNCRSLSSMVLPRINYFGTYSFSGCYTLSTMVLSQNTTKLNSSFCSNTLIASVILPDSITSINDSAFSSCISMSSITIPNSITTIDSSAFSNCRAMAFYDFSNHIAIPTLSATNAFNNIPSDCKIIVPDALYDEWIAATNWSTYASKIIKKSDWDASQA